jgi:hypothetical protein
MDFVLANTLPGYVIRALAGNPENPVRINKRHMKTEIGSEPPSSIGGIPV